MTAILDASGTKDRILADNLLNIDLSRFSQRACEAVPCSIGVTPQETSIELPAVRSCSSDSAETSSGEHRPEVSEQGAVAADVEYGADEQAAQADIASTVINLVSISVAA